MPTYTAMALDTLLEPGGSKSVDKAVSNTKPPLPNLKSFPDSKLERRASTSSLEKKVSRPQISPALYATPVPTPVPDTPSSFPPSPYIVNHKRRGPRLLKSHSEQDVAYRQKTFGDQTNVTWGPTKTQDDSVTCSFQDCTEAQNDSSDYSGVNNNKQTKHFHLFSPPDQALDTTIHDESGSNCRDTNDSCEINGLVSGNNTLNLSPVSLARFGDAEDFFEPAESPSFTCSADGEDNTESESTTKLATPMQEFYDAWEELSSDSGQQTVIRDIDSDLREIRLNLLTEIEKRRQADETVVSIQSNWQKIRQQLALVGVTLPEDLTCVEEEELLNVFEELTIRVDIARFVSDAVGRGMIKAEIEMEMEAQIESKNFEIARLYDRLHYYEAVNHEMSHRNQEAVELARRDRQKRKRRQRWVWGSIATAITLGTAALAWSYLQPGSSSASNPEVPEHHESTK